MRKNPLLTTLIALSAAAHILLLTQVALPSGFFNRSKLSVRFESGETAKRAEKLNAQEERKVEPAKQIPPRKAPSNVEKTAAAPSSVAVMPKKTQRAAPPLPAPPPNPLPENSIVPANSVLETASVNPNSPAGLKNYDTETVGNKSTARVENGVPGGTGTDPDGGRSIAEKKAPPSDEPPRIDKSAIIREYGGKIKTMIERRKVYPEQARLSNVQGEVKLRFTISADGALLKAGVSGGSGSEILDTAAVRAVRDAAPFPKLPQELGMSSLELSIKLVYSYR